MGNPTVVVNTYSDSPTGHTNISFYDANGNWVGTYGANLGSTSMPGDFGGVFAENPNRPASWKSTLSFNDSQWSNALNHARDAANMTSGGAGQYVPIGKNCYDFVDDVLGKAGLSNNTAWQHMKPGSVVQTYGKVQYELTHAFEMIYQQAINDESFGTGYNQQIQTYLSFRMETIGGWSSYTEDDGWDVTGKINRLETETWVSPIVIDTNGDGFQITELSSSEATFDYYGRDQQIKTAWIQGDDAFLVIDKNHDGYISNLSELFGGNVVGEGFDKLRLLDFNGDGAISAGDNDWDSLQLWFDHNSNGISEEGELRSLQEVGLQSIDLSSVRASVRVGDGFITEISSAVIDNRSVAAADIFFRVGGIANDTIILDERPRVSSDENLYSFDLADLESNFPSLYNYSGQFTQDYMMV